MVRKLKSDISQVNQIVTSHLTSIKQIGNQLGQISAQINARPNGWFLSDTVVNLKNDSHIIVIFTRSGRTHGKDVVDLNEYPNEK